MMNNKVSVTNSNNPTISLSAVTLTLLF
ncbi:hypothetical protein, partial [Klebsiella pneumoniae]